jgi:tetratricopeptide (TPR) repeat protein
MLLAEVLHKRGMYQQSAEILDGLLTDDGQMGARAAAFLADQAYLRGDFSLSRELAERASAMAPQAISCRITLGNLCDAAGAQSASAYTEAMAHFRRAIAARPDLPLARVYLATALIREGAFAEGLAEWVTAECLGGTYANRVQCTVWDGRPLGSDRLMILTHSGYGDVIQFLRFVRHLREREPRASLGLMIRAPLAELARATGLFDTVFAEGAPTDAFDWQVSQTHLPLLLGLGSADLRGYEPYLAASPARIEAASGWLRTRRPGRLRVGLRWTGHPGYTDATRSLPLGDLRLLFEVEGIDWVSLAEGNSHRGANVSDFGLADIAAHLIDFEATAAVMHYLDLVISVDTSVAHLAGALGRPTWLLARPNPDWRWGREGEATPWYGTVRVFRHPGGQLNWSAVAVNMAAALRAVVGNRKLV